MSRRNWNRAISVVLMLVMVLSALLVLTAPVQASSERTIGLPRAVPDYMKYINVNNFRFDPLAELPSIPAELRYDSVPVNQPFYYIVQFNGPVTPQMKTSLAATGATILYYVNYNAFVVRADGYTILSVKSLSTVRWVGVFQPAFKLSPSLSDAYGEMVQRALDRERYGTVATGGAMTVIGPSGLSKSLYLDSFGTPMAAGPAGLTARATVPSLLGGAASASAQGGSSSVKKATITVEILAFEKSRMNEILRGVNYLGGSRVTYTLSDSGMVRAEVQKADLNLIARIPGVKFIDRYVQPYFDNDIARWVIQSGNEDTYATPVHDQGIWGTGQIVTLGDTGIDFENDAFEDPDVPAPGPTHRKVLDYYEGCTSGCDLQDNGINHGTHTSGTIAGDDGTWHFYDGDPTGSSGTVGPHDGQAFDAFIEMQDLSNDGFYVYFDDILDLWNFAVDRDSWIHSNSWGSCCSDYIDDSRKTDDFIWNNQNFLVVFAAGNAGDGGLYTMNPYAGSKNVIAAGATVNGPGREGMASFSSRGPMRDGRLKPDVTAPGVSVWSAHGCDPGACDDYWQLSGTSMATPTVAGAATLVRQYYMDGWYPTGSADPLNGFTPTAALTKATLINSAAEMTGSGAYGFGETWYPNDNQGFGRILLDDGLFFSGNVRGLAVDDHTTGLNTTDSVSYQLAIGDSSLPVEITLVWTDFQDADLSPPNLVNDLDLIVTAPDGTVYFGNKYMGYNPGESEPNPADTDHLNNVESVLVITNVQAGLWNVEVSAVDIPEPAQTFAIVMTGGIATERGIVQMDKNNYQSSATVNIKVVDTGLNQNPLAPDTATVNMYSTTETTAEVVTLTETGDATAVFVGSIQLVLSATPISDGSLQVQDGDQITAEYLDANDGSGNPATVFDYALVDDTAPVISNILTTNLRFNRATIVWDTDELSDSVLWWGDTTPPPNVKSSTRLVTSHSLTISGLTETTTYYYYVESTDEAGNTATDDNATDFYWFVTPVKPPTAPPNEEWPTFHNNQPRQGISPSIFDPPIDLQWTAGPALLQLWTGPVMADGILFSATLDGHMRARDPYSGTVIWDRTLGGQYYYTGTASVENGVVYATFYGGGGGAVYALDELTGDTIWSSTAFDFNARIAMATADGLVFGSAWSGEIYALNEADGSVAWSYQTGDSYPFGGPTVASAQVFQGTTTGNVFALDEFSGDLIWSTAVDDTVTSPPLYAQGNVYVGTYSGSMYALDAFTGDVVWQTGGLGLIDFSTPAYDGLDIYFGSYGNNAYYALDATDGTVLWQTGVGGPIGSSVAYANGFVYGTAWDGQLRTMDTIDGTIVDSETLLSWASTSMPAISEGWVWIEDYDGNIYGFLGQLPVGLIVSPLSQASDAVPDSTVDYRITVKNIGISGPDTFDATITLGALGWAVDLYEADGVTPLSDTDGDFIPDTGSLATGESVTVVARVTVPPTVNPGDSDLSLVTFTSSNDVTRFKTAKLTTTVPPPGVSVGPRAYFNPNPGDTVTATLDVRNTGGFDDTIDITAASGNGWTVRLYESDGVTPLSDTDSDLIPDVGLVAGLQSATLVVQVDVPASTPQDTLERTAITGTSSLDTNAKDTSLIVIELVAPPDAEWPTFHNDKPRHGQSPAIMGPPMTRRWSAGPNVQQLWTGPVMADGILFSTTLDGFIRARDPFSGDVLWSRRLGDTYYYTDTPTIADGVVYTAFYGDSGGSFYALDEITGATIWSLDSRSGYDFNARVALAYADGMVFGSDWNGLIFALNAADGSTVWDFGTGFLPFGGVTVSGGLVFMPVIDEFAFAGYLYALDEMTGSLVWSVPLDDVGTSVPLYAQGSVFEGTYSGSMYALDAQTGAVVWQATGYSQIDFSTPAYDGVAIYFGTFDNRYIALDIGDGSLLWQASLNGPVGSSLAYANGYLYGTAWDGTFRVLRASDGAIVDSHQLDSFASTSAPAIARGWVWLEDYDGNIYGFAAPGAGEVRGVTVSPATASLAVTQAALFRARGVDAYDNPLKLSSVSWATLANLGTVLPVSTSGDLAVYVAGASAGLETLEATSEGFSGTADVDVLPGPLDHVAVTPGVASVAAGQTQLFSAAALDRFGNPISGSSFTWAATGGIGTINAAGLFTATTAVGTGTVTATSGTKTGTAIVEIVPGALDTLVATPSTIVIDAGTSTLVYAGGYDAFGNEVYGTSYAWSTTIGSITPTGAGANAAMLSAGFSAGTGTLDVAGGGKTVMVSVTVRPGPVNRIAVSPSSPAVAAGGTLGFSATPMDLFGNAISGLTLVWTASSSVGTIDQTGLLTAATSVATGTVTVSAGSVSVTLDVNVVPGPLASIVVSPTSLPSVTAGSTTGLVATAQDQYGNSIRAATIAWSASAGSILPLSADGSLAQYTAPTSTTPGTATITATSGGFSRTVTATIVPGPAVSVTISASAASVAAGGTLTFTAAVSDAYGNAISGPTVGWSASAGSISSAGVLTAPQTSGSVVVTASSSGRQAVMTVQVTAASLDRLEVTPTSISVSTGSGAALSVVGKDTYGNEVSGATYTWTTTVGAVQASGDGTNAAFFSGDAGGSGTITVASGGKSATISVSITESSLPIGRQAVQTTSILFLVVAIVAIAASIFLFVKYREATRKLAEKGEAPEEGEKGEKGGGP